MSLYNAGLAVKRKHVDDVLSHPGPGTSKFHLIQEASSVLSNCRGVAGF